ncbi:hypothetical protein [Hymenobacter koreensis]|uniref:Lipoprotein n=1 Tax=Hymenobacter koreensis TaxID=1084523 RepID=A0ABP8ITF2_9BACT
MIPKFTTSWQRITLALSLGAMSFGLMGIGCCDCFDGDVSTFRLPINTDSLSGRGFRAAELRSAYLLAYATPNLLGQPDTFRQPLPQATSIISGQYLDIRNDYVYLEGLARNPAGELVKSYRLRVPVANRSFELTDLDVKVGGGGGRCGCKHTKRKELTLDGQRVDAEKSPMPMLNR